MAKYKIEWSVEARLDLLDILGSTLKETNLFFIAINSTLKSKEVLS